MGGKVRKNCGRIVFYAALLLRHSLIRVIVLLVWNLSGNSKWTNCSVEQSENSVPAVLFDFLAWCTRSPEHTEVVKRIRLSLTSLLRFPVQKWRINSSYSLSIAQDLIALQSSGKKKTPKQLSLGLTYSTTHHRIIQSCGFAAWVWTLSLQLVRDGT